MVNYFGKDPNGRNVTRCEISNGGTRVSVLAWGATIQELRTDGMEHSLILGGRSMAAYLGPMRYFGAIVGPVANRIAGGEMKVAGRSFALDKNEAGRTTLHGGLAGFDQQLWTFSDIAASSCRLKLTHADGFGGFPGNISVATTYSLDAQGALKSLGKPTSRPTSAQHFMGIGICPGSRTWPIIVYIFLRPAISLLMRHKFRSANRPPLRAQRSTIVSRVTSDRSWIIPFVWHLHRLRW